MRILLISSAFSGLTQRFYTELDDAGYFVSVELHLGDEAKLLEGVALCQPDLIVCPYLTRKLPAELYRQHTCLIVHPGIVGDRGPSSLDWAIQEGADEWGVTLLQADEQMDAGPIWASQSFPLRPASKSSIFNREVTQAAVDCLWRALTFHAAPSFKPTALDYQAPTVKGRLRPAMKQADRAIDWQKQGTRDILRRIWAADGSPGVLDVIKGREFYLFNAQAEPNLHGKPGEIIAIGEQAICRATRDGALWIGHLKAKLPDGNGLKLPAVQALQGLLPESSGWLARPIRQMSLDYTLPGRQLPLQEVWYEIHGEAAYLHFAFHNGGMSTKQCQLLLQVYRHVASLDVKAIVLLGGDDFWSNGIHLNQIEAAVNPADESWANINAIDDLILQILLTLDKLTITAVSGNAGAGGAILAIAADRVWVRDGVIFNPHYKNMGGLYGSEYWTYLLPKRLGQALATQLTEQRLPLSAKKAWSLGIIDKVLDHQHALFAAQVRHSVATLLADTAGYAKLLDAKAAQRCRDEAAKPLQSYRKFELSQMYQNFYGDQAYDQARHNFVRKAALSETPRNLARHRQENWAPAGAGSLVHFVWQDSYELGDAKVDSQHKDFFVIAEKLITAKSRDVLLDIMFNLYQHVKEHFVEEETIMKQVGFHHYAAHVKEHNVMLDKLMEMDKKIQDDNWQASDIQEFLDKWTKHIVNSDMLFNQHWKEMNKFSV